jgi:hypothetical protein
VSPSQNHRFVRNYLTKRYRLLLSLSSLKQTCTKLNTYKDLGIRTATTEDRQAQLVELQFYHSTDNLCCGGVDEESGGRRVILDLSDGKQALSVDERTEVDSYDDSVEEDADTTQFASPRLATCTAQQETW